jgi:hypothetical protein
MAEGEGDWYSWTICRQKCRQALGLPND